MKVRLAVAAMVFAGLGASAGAEPGDPPPAPASELRPGAVSAPAAVEKPKPVERSVAPRPPAAKPATEPVVPPPPAARPSEPVPYEPVPAAAPAATGNGLACWLSGFAMLLVGFAAGFVARHLVSRRKLGGMTVRIGTWRGIP